MYALLVSIPLITGTLAVVIFMWSFYGIKYNQWGVKPNKEHNNYFPILGALGHKSGGKDEGGMSEKGGGQRGGRRGRKREIKSQYLDSLKKASEDWDTRLSRAT